MTEKDWSGLWGLDPEIVFLNHGSFGACPRAILREQFRLQERLEFEPVRFYMRDLMQLHDDAREALAGFVGSAPENLVFVNNATTGVNTAIRSIPFEPGDEVLVTDHEYPASRNALDFIAARRGAVVKPVSVPFPSAGDDEVVSIVLDAVGPRTRYALLDHITSQTGMLLPIKALVRELKAKGVETIVDGAHAVGMVPLELDELGAAYFTSNCHKWLCTPKGAAFLHIRPEFQELTRPLVLSHGASQSHSDRPHHWIEFDWAGTSDPTAHLVIPAAIEYLGGLLPGGWDELRQRNHDLAIESRNILCRALDIEAPTPDSMIGTLVGLPLPDGVGEPGGSIFDADPLTVKLTERNITVPIVDWPRWPKRLIRTSSQLYNRIEHAEILAAALQELLKDPTLGVQ